MEYPRGISAEHVRQVFDGAADLVIFDPNERWTVTEEFTSKAKNSPFIGESLYGKVKYTICGGEIVYEDK